MEKFLAEDIAVYALSYDEADALGDFREAHKVSYTLLSDPESDVIRSFGILNTLIDEDDHPWFGIPYPGTYVINTDGEITHKFFDGNLSVRVGPEQMLRAALGRSLPESVTVVSKPQEVQDVEFSIQLEGSDFRGGVKRDLVAQFRVPQGRHVYASPATQGMIAVDIILDPCEGLVQRPMIRPSPEKHRLAGTDEVFDVHHGAFELRMPLTVNSAAKGDITISGQVVWQSCNDEICDIPVRKRFEMTVPVKPSLPHPVRTARGAELEPNAAAHFKKMTDRRK